MDFYLSNWEWVTDGVESYYAPPAGAIGTIDLGLVPEMAIPGVPRKGCLFWSNDAQPSEHTLLAKGDLREVKSSTKIKQRFKSLMGYAPDGDTLDAMVMDCLIGGSDPEGLDAPMPIMPDQKGWMELHLPGIGNVKNERFEWKNTPHKNKIRTMLRKEFGKLNDDAKVGKLRDIQHPRRVLDAWCDKFGLQGTDDWKELIPPAILKDVQGRLKHETTYTDDFNRADSTGITGWSAVIGSGFDIFSNQARGTASGPLQGTRYRYNSDLSSSDSYSQADIISFGTSSGTNAGVFCRCSSSADTNYLWFARLVTTPTRALQKVISGTGTAIASDNTAAPAVSFSMKVSANGSAVKVYLSGSEVVSLATTDTSIASGLRGGIQARQSVTAAERGIIDNFETGDLAPSGLLYTQLERGVRGVRRGMYTRWGG